MLRWRGILIIYDSTLSLEAAKIKARDFKLTGASTVLTACPSCIVNINRGLAEIREKNIKAKGISVFLAKKLKVTLNKELNIKSYLLSNGKIRVSQRLNHMNFLIAI